MTYVVNVQDKLTAINHRNSYSSQTILKIILIVKNYSLQPSLASVKNNSENRRMENMHNIQMQEGQEKTRQYFIQQVEPIFENLITKIVLHRPEDILEFSKKYFKHQIKNNGETQEDSSDTDSDRFEDVSQEDFSKMKSHKRQNNLIRDIRNGVSSQSNTMSYAPRKPISLRKAGLKNQRTQIMMRFYFMNSFLFQNFDEEQKNLTMESMIPQKTVEGQQIITEGDYGDCMYFVEEGLFECSMISDKKDVQYLKNYQKGDTFGELCLLHSAKRQATVVSKMSGLIYSLTRQVYNHIKKMFIVKRRSMYIENLTKVNILSTLSKEQLQKLCDLLKETTVQAGQYVIYEGDMGTKFYIVLAGMLVAKSTLQDTFYQYYKEGDYFGQLALMNKKPRQVSVQAFTRCKLVSLSSQVFLNVVNRDKADTQLKNKYKDARPRTTARRKKIMSIECG